ncbi:hypothetical protein [Devosia sp. 1566]|uniref:hypothetical protein n=1 Tax=Devosia sp. 1566 TaxID=2499144 RepID=UPI000FD8FFB3|nr:hypothetical protein [Devosia sp. 1566]
MSIRIVKGAVLSSVVILAAGTTQAQEIASVDRTKVYVSDPAGCDALEKDGLDAISILGFQVMTFDDGIQTLESSCHFFDIKAKPGNAHLFVSAVCENPGAIYPDTLALTPLTSDTVQVVSSHEAAMSAAATNETSSEGASPGATLFHRCANLSELPR